MSAQRKNWMIVEQLVNFPITSQCTSSQTGWNIFVVMMPSAGVKKIVQQTVEISPADCLPHNLLNIFRSVLGAISFVAYILKFFLKNSDKSNFSHCNRLLIFVFSHSETAGSQSIRFWRRILAS